MSGTWRFEAGLRRVKEPDLSDLVGRDRMVQRDRDDSHAIVRPFATLFHVGNRLHVAVGEMNLYIEVVLASAEVVLTRRDPQVDLTDAA